jgi:hypothetical protein
MRKQACALVASNHVAIEATQLSRPVVHRGARQGRIAMNTVQRRPKPRVEITAAVLEHIEKHGRLQVFSALPQERLALIKLAIEQGLIGWNKVVGEYELTAVGQRRLEDCLHKIATGGVML